LINCAIDYIRKNKKVMVWEEVQDSKGCRIEEPTEEWLDLYNAVDRLEDKCKTVVILKYFQDMTLGEIAEVLQYPVGTVKSQLHRALKELRLDIGEDRL